MSSEEKGKNQVAKLQRAAWARFWYQVAQLRTRLSALTYREWEYTVDYLPDRDAARLPQLQAMGQRYGLEFEETARVLITYWMEHAKKHGRHPRLLPVRTGNLVGRVSERVLAQYVADQYPNGEQWEEIQQEAQAAVLSPEPEAFSLDRVEGPTVKDEARAYSQYCLKIRLQRFAQTQKKESSARNWRGNPFRLINPSRSGTIPRTTDSV